MKYKIIQNLPGKKAGEIIDGAKDYEYECRDHPESFEPIVEKKTYDELREGDEIFRIPSDGKIHSTCYHKTQCRSQFFLTREEAEDEHKRREWAVRKDRFVPKKGQLYYSPSHDGTIHTWKYNEAYVEIITINSGLAFRTREDCQDAINNHDPIRLFYTIR